MRPKCEKCGGALLGEYPEPHVLVVKCSACGWRRTRVTAEHPVLSVSQAKQGVRPDPKQEEVAMAKQKECRRCGRMIQLVMAGSCYRCLARIKKGLDPVTGMPVAVELIKNLITESAEFESASAEMDKFAEMAVKGGTVTSFGEGDEPLVPKPLMAALVELAEEAVERVTELGEIEVEPPLLPENWGKIPCGRCGEFNPFGESCHCVLRGLPDDSEGGEEWYEAVPTVEAPSSFNPLLRSHNPFVRVLRLPLTLSARLIAHDVEDHHILALLTLALDGCVERVDK